MNERAALCNWAPAPSIEDQRRYRRASLKCEEVRLKDRLAEIEAELAAMPPEADLR